MKLIVALALAVRVSSSPTECPPFDCIGLSNVCQTYNSRCQLKNLGPESGVNSEADCRLEVDENGAPLTKWCPEPAEKPPQDVTQDCAPVFKDCAQFSSVCQVFNKNTCKTKNKGKLTEKECDAKNDVSEFARGTTEWCPEASQEQLQARCDNKNQCIIRDAKNGKLIRKQKSNAACEASLYDCALAFVSDCAPVYDCTQFSGVCLVFESCLVNDSSLTEEECNLKNKNDGRPGGFDTARWCRG